MFLRVGTLLPLWAVITTWCKDSLKLLTWYPGEYRNRNDRWPLAVYARLAEK